MKRTIIALTLLLTCISVCALDFSNVNVRFAPGKPLYEENKAYAFSDSFSFKYMVIPKDENLLPNGIMVSKENSYEVIPFRDVNVENNRFWHLKGAANASLVRFSFNNTEAELYISGGMNSCFASFGALDMLGMDGIYGAGFSFSFNNKLVLRIGIHHFSGHWGDEILKKFFERNGNGYCLTEYTRNNSWLFNACYNVSDAFRITSEFELPRKNSWIRPAAHVPAATVIPNSEEKTSSHIHEQEGHSGKCNDLYPSSYKAMRIGFGAEYSMGNFYASCDFEFHQDGKIDTDTLCYDENRKWDREYAFAIGYVLNKVGNSPETSIELSYRNGRFPLTNFFFQKTRYIAAGIVIKI